MNKNVWHTLESYLCVQGCKEVWYKTMVIHWSRFWEEVVLPSMKTVHKESGTISREYKQYCHVGKTAQQCRLGLFQFKTLTLREILKIQSRLHVRSHTYGGSCKEVCGTILWVGKQNYTTTLQSIYSMHRWPSLQRGRNEICWRIVKYMLSNGSAMLILGTNWTTWYIVVSKQARTFHNKMD